MGAKGVGAKVEGPVEAREEGVMAVVLVEAMEAAVMGGHWWRRGRWRRGWGWIRRWIGRRRGGR